MARYRVCGTQTVAGHKHGDTFDAFYSDEHELYLLQGCHLELVHAEPSNDGDADNADKATQNSGVAAFPRIRERSRTDG